MASTTKVSEATGYGMLCSAIDSSKASWTTQASGFGPSLMKRRQEKGVLFSQVSMSDNGSTVAQKLAEQGGNKPSTGSLTLSSFWSDFNCRPVGVFNRMATTPVLWTMATQDIVYGLLEFTKGVYDKLEGPKEICILEGEHLPQYYEPGFARSADGRCNGFFPFASMQHNSCAFSSCLMR